MFFYLKLRIRVNKISEILPQYAVNGSWQSFPVLFFPYFEVWIKNITFLFINRKLFYHSISLTIMMQINKEKGKLKLHLLA